MVYWELFTDVQYSLFFLSPFNYEHFTRANIYMTKESIKIMINSEMIGTQICPDTEMSNNCT